MIDGIGIGVELAILAGLFWMLLRFRSARRRQGKRE